ncbi:MAG: hypothetical protein IBJ03_02980 [Gemmatimonadaceae bacterium]|nr:hypothetical protein [Gemmatimonadaceae bacterium]
MRTASDSFVPHQVLANMTHILLSPPWSARRALGLCVLGVLLTACRNEGTSPAAAEARLAGASRALAPGEEMSKPGDTSLFVSLIGVTQDSRCPASVVCVWAGDAHVQLAYRLGRSGPSVPFTLKLNTAPRDTIIGTTRVTLDSLTPYPQEPTQPVPASSYRAWLTMEAVAR